jgi:hypothetical protein
MLGKDQSDLVTRIMYMQGKWNVYVNDLNNVCDFSLCVALLLFRIYCAVM